MKCVYGTRVELNAGHRSDGIFEWAKQDDADLGEGGNKTNSCRFGIG